MMQTLESILTEEYVWHPDLARELGVSTDTLKVWGRRNKGPKRTSIAGRIYYRRADVVEWQKAKAVKKAKGQLARGASRGDKGR